MNQVTPSPYNPVHFVYFKQSSTVYHFKDTDDDLFQNRVDRYRMNAFYAQKWQTSDTIKLQFLTEGIGQLELQVLNSSKKEVTRIVSTVINDPAIYSPVSLKQIDVPLSGFAIGCYQFVVYAAGVKLMQSEWQQVAVDFPETLVFEYYNRTNKLNGYFTAFRPMLRVEAQMEEAEPDLTFSHYRDEPGNSETLYGIVTKKRKLKIGNDFGVPDWIHILISQIFMLSNVRIEGIGFALIEGTKITITKLDGYPLYYSSFEIERSKNANMAVTDAALPVLVNIAAVNIDAGSVGIGTGVIQVNVN